MNIWTTFCPGKISWELTYIETKGKSPSNNWYKYRKIIDESLQTLKDAGIVGIRLVIYPSEITQDGKEYNWKPLETILTFCEKRELAVDLCIGPFQYPNYPGIYLPPALLQHIPTTEQYLDSNQTLAAYGLEFLKQQVSVFSNHKRIHGFHLANEWPDMQRVAGKESIRIGVSEKFMIHAASTLKQMTTKPILLNTNIDAGNTAKLTNTFTNILTIMGPQVKLGFDIYPSQETWLKTPLQKLTRLFQPYPHSFSRSQERFAPCEMIFVEVEAQPWGNGQAWFHLIKKAEDAQYKVLTYSRDSLQKTWKKHIAGTSCQTVSLWGADFWLSAKKMGITWPLEEVQKIALNPSR